MDKLVQNIRQRALEVARYDNDRLRSQISTLEDRCFRLIVIALILLVALCSCLYKVFVDTVPYVGHSRSIQRLSQPMQPADVKVLFYFVENAVNKIGDFLVVVPDFCKADTAKFKNRIGNGRADIDIIFVAGLEELYASPSK